MQTTQYDHSGHRTACGPIYDPMVQSHIWSSRETGRLIDEFKPKNRAVTPRLAGVAALYQLNATKFARRKKGRGYEL